MIEYIDKQAVIDAVESVPAGNWSSKRYVGEIERITPAEVRPVVRGRWIDYDDDYGAYSCSKCEKDAPEDIQWNFCPNCGADMRGEG